MVTEPHQKSRKSKKSSRPRAEKRKSTATQQGGGTIMPGARKDPREQGSRDEIELNLPPYEHAIRTQRPHPLPTPEWVLKATIHPPHRRWRERPGIVTARRAPRVSARVFLGGARSVTLGIRQLRPGNMIAFKPRSRIPNGTTPTPAAALPAWTRPRRCSYDHRTSSGLGCRCCHHAGGFHRRCPCRRHCDPGAGS